MESITNFLAPTPPAGDSSNRVADTAFVAQALSGVFTGQKIDVQFVIPGGGAVISTGTKGWLHVPITATIGTWAVLADQVGTVTVDILRANNAFPQTSIIGGGVKPNLASAQFSAVAPSGWSSVVLVPNDWVSFVVTGTVTNVTQITVNLGCTR